MDTDAMTAYYWKNLKDIPQRQLADNDEYHVCFEHYPEFLENPNIRQRVVELLQKAKEYIVKLEGEFAYD